MVVRLSEQDSAYTVVGNDVVVAVGYAGYQLLKPILLKLLYSVPLHTNKILVS
jgi:hypothetical protein